MSVPVSRRGISTMEFYNTAVQLRIELSKWLLRDFGMRKKIKRVSIVSKAAGMDEADAEAFLSLLQKYNLADKLAEDYPDWWIQERRRSVDSLCSRLMQNIRGANAIYPTSEEEYWARRVMQNAAISTLDALVEELQFIVLMLHQTLGVDVEKYMPYIDMITKEQALLKGWRKSDNKLLRQIKEKGKKKPAK